MVDKLNRLQKEQDNMEFRMKKILGEEPEMKKQDKLDLVLESLNKNLEKIATNIGGKGPPGVMLRKVNGEHITS